MFLVAELDRGDLDEQASVLKHLTLRYPWFPLVLVVFSGGKSLHPWFHTRGATEADIADGARLLREGNGTAFVLLRVKPTEPAAFKRNFDASLCRDRFRAALRLA